MSSNKNLFLGRWQLDPTQSQYELGQPPQSGFYMLEPEGNGLKVTIEWVAADDKSYQLTYFGIPDGKDYPYENPAIADSMSMSYPDAQTLDSTAKKDHTEKATHPLPPLKRGITALTPLLRGVGGVLPFVWCVSFSLWYNNLSVYHKKY